jgi:hypothetical protein
VKHAERANGAKQHIVTNTRHERRNFAGGRPPARDNMIVFI